MGSLSHTLYLDSLLGNPREEIVKKCFLHAAFDSWLLKTGRVSAALPTEANWISTKDPVWITLWEPRMLLVAVMMKNS